MPRAPFPSPNLGATDDPFTALARRFVLLIVDRARAGTPANPAVPIWDLPADVPNPPPEFLPDDLLEAGERRYQSAIEQARDYVPLPYQGPFVEPLLRHLGRVVRSRDSARAMWKMAEVLAGAVAQHHPGHPARPALRRFLAVVSNLHRSFLSTDRRASAEVPLLADPPLPPLVAFHHDPAGGPGLLAPDMVRRVCGSLVPVAILPGTYSRTPLAWASVAHEACGHGVLRADPGLLPELIAGIRTLFGGGPVAVGAARLTDAQALALVWSTWAEEAASDVCGLLNVGPAFALNLAAYLAAVRGAANDDGQLTPVLTVHAGDDPAADLGVHPPDVLRVYLAIGAVRNLAAFPAGLAKPYLTALTRIAEYYAAQAFDESPAARKVRVRGKVEVDRDRWLRVDHTFALKDLAESARRVGAFIATTRLAALNNRSLQDLETWDVADEETARSICAALLDARSPKVRRVEAGAERYISIEEALKEIHVDAARRTAVIEHLRNDRFGELKDNELITLGLGAAMRADVKARLLRALADDRVEDVPASLIAPLHLDRIESMGDDAHLIAGATLAALNDAAELEYRWVNRRLARALTKSFERDAIMGLAHVHQMVDRGDDEEGTWQSRPPAEVADDPIERAADVGVGGPPAGNGKVPANRAGGRRTVRKRK